MSLTIYLCPAVKTSAANDFSCLYGYAENVQNDTKMIMAWRKY